MIEGEVSIAVAFHDVDPASMLWHGHYPRYLEQARVSLLERIGYSYLQMADSGFVWPVTDMQIRYRHPLRYGDRARIVARLVQWEYRLRVEYRVSNQQEQLCATARTDQLAVDMDSGDYLVGSPQVLLDRVKACL